MKELSVEEKAKAYDNALEKAKSFNNRWKSIQATDSELALKELKEIFPELKESEDERIRKALINFFSRFPYDSIEAAGTNAKESLAWLEKQGEQKPTTVDIDKMVDDYANRRECGNEEFGKPLPCMIRAYKQGLNDTIRKVSLITAWSKEDERLRKTTIAFLKDFAEQGYENAVECIDWLEKQGEQYPKFRIGDTIKEKSTSDIVTISEVDLKNREYRLSNTGFIPFKYEHLWELVEQKSINKIKPKFKVGDTMRTLQEANDGYTDGMPVVVSIDDEYYHCTNELIAIKDQDYYEFPPINVNQEPANKVEPKFHKGEWITSEESVLQVDEVKTENYLLIDSEGILFAEEIETIDSEFHLWTIRDAKGGDVLAAHECIVLFKEIDGLNIKCYCTYHYMGFNPSFYVDTLQNKTAFYPATKEQRDTLFAKMRKAGYVWNADKKELEKISQRMISAEAKEVLYDKVNWGEEDNYGFDCVAQCITQALLSSNTKQDSDICKCARNWINSIKQRLTNKEEK